MHLGKIWLIYSHAVVLYTLLATADLVFFFSLFLDFRLPQKKNQLIAH